MPASPSILIVGGGPAGTFAAIAAKKTLPEAEVVLLTDESCEPYEKPPLSKAVLLRKAQPLDASIAGPGGVVSHGVLLRSGARCTAIDRSAREVTLQDASRIAYDALVLATGATVRQVPQLPAGMPRVHYLRSAEDARRLTDALESCRRLLIVGGGLIGLEVAAAAAELGIHTTVLEIAPRLLSRVCYDDIGELVHAVHQRHGVDIRLATTIHSAEPRADGRIAILTADGETLTGDAVVVGTGTVPDDRLAAAAGLATGHGIIVDERCRTSDPAIFAAGDAVRFPGASGLVRLENWKHAVDQGTVAGRNAAGASDVYAPVPSFWSEQYDLYIQGLGWPSGDAERVRRGPIGNTAMIFEVSGGRLVAALGINAQRDLAAARRLISQRVPVDGAALADPALPLPALLKR